MPPKPESTPASRRADAERNREKIIAAARAAFADPDADVSMAEVARRAEVGSATLYRNFTSRRQLLEALYLDEIAAVCEAADDAPGSSPGEAFANWLRRFVDYFTSKRVVAAELLKATDPADPFFGRGYDRVTKASRPLLKAAQDAGEVRTDLTLEQVLDLLVAIAEIPGDEHYREPILTAAIDALRPPS